MKQLEFQWPFYDLVERLFESEAHRINKTIGGSKYRFDIVARDRGYKCVHLNVSRFIDTLKKVLERNFPQVPKERPILKFLDVGCGVGQKVFLASSLFELQAHGLELRKPLVKGARNLLQKIIFPHHVNEAIIEGNAITFRRYSEFDIIYFYCPIADHELEIKLEKQIARTAKQGAIVIGFLTHYFNDHNDEELKKLGWRYYDMGCDGYYKRVRRLT